MNSVTVRKAFKFYGKGDDRKIVLNGLNMNVKTSSIYVIIGASGCGKTTLLTAMIGMNPLDQGEIVVLGERLRPDRLPKVCNRIGFMPQEISLHNEFTVDETLNFFGNVYQMDDKILAERSEMLKNLLELPPDDRKVRECSGGQQRRISLAVAMIHDPKLLILDEPTVGQDPLLREKIWKFLFEVTRTSQLSIILTTHYIEEARHVDRCGMMRNGIFLEEDSPSAIMQKTQSEGLDEAFLRLCVRRGKNDGVEKVSNFDQNASVDITAIELDQMNPNHDGEIQRDDVKARKYFHRKTLKALIYKSYIQVARHPISLYMIFIAIVQSIIFNTVVGRNPQNLKIGIVSDELNDFEDCYDSTLITAIAYENRSCHLNSISCRYIDEITDELGDKVFYKNFDEALRDGKNGKLIAVIRFNSNFTESTQEILENSYSEDNVDFVLDNREIQVYLDKSNFQFTLFIQKGLLDVYQKYTESLMEDCGINRNLAAAPVRFMKPIYGELEINNRVYMGPMVFLAFFFFGIAVNTVTNFMDDRNNGSWNRTFLTGVETMEFIFCHSLIHLAIGAFQVAVTVNLMFWFYPKTAEANTVLIVMLFSLLGICGFCYGIVLGCCFNRFESASLFACMIGDVVMKLSGFLWPLAAMAPVVQFVSKYFLVTTHPLISLNDIVYKGYGISDKSVWQGFLLMILWSIFFLTLSWKVLEKKKFARN